MTVAYLVDGEPFTADDARAYAEARLGRPLTDGELALDLVGLDLDLAEGKERLTAAIEREKRRVLEARLAGRGAVMEITPEIEAVVADLVEAGRRHAREEIERLTGIDVSGSRSLVEGGGGWLDRLLGNLISYLTALRVRVNNEAGAAEFSGQSRITEELIDRLDDRIPGARDAASRIVSGLLLGGLGEVYEENADLFPCFTYSAVMDGATCRVCRTFDGTRYETWAEGEAHLPGGGPNPLCLGDGRCRCRLVPCPPGERVEEPEPEPVSPEIAAIREEIDRFQGLSDREFVDLIRGNYDSDVFSRAGGPSADLREREDRIRDVGRRIEDEANRRFDEEAFERERDEWERRVDESRDRYRDEIERAYDFRLERMDAIEREMFGERGAQSNAQLDMVEERLRDDPDYRESEDRKNRIEEEHHDLVREAERHTDPLLRMAEARRSVLADLRALGGDFSERDTDELPEAYRRPINYREINDRRWIDVVGTQSSFLPSDWIEASNDRRGGFHVSMRDRGHYADGLDMVAISGSDDDDRRSVALHELGHRMEYVLPEIRVWEWAFMWRRQEESRRNRTYDRGRLNDYRPGHGYGDHEWAEPDDFVDPYTGRDYGRDPSSTYEVVSMGLTGLFHGDAIDDDHRDFVLGLLATVRAPDRQRPPVG